VPDPIFGPRPRETSTGSTAGSQQVLPAAGRCSPRGRRGHPGRRVPGPGSPPARWCCWRWPG